MRFFHEPFGWRKKEEDGNRTEQNNYSNSDRSTVQAWDECARKVADSRPQQGAGEGSSLDYVNYVYGWRSWSVNGIDGYLYPQNAHFGPWAPGRQEAKCNGGAWHEGQKNVQRYKHENIYSKILEGVDYNHRAYDAWLNGLKEQVVPHIKCKCGFYSLLDPSRVPHSGIDYSIIGTVRNSGIVIDGNKGYRSQYSEIDTLFIHEQNGDIAHVLVDNYSVPVHVVPDRMWSGKLGGLSIF